ncbi:MAG: phosphate acetyltransferase [Planctomycetes bacterium]|nr:phosphate acetyltransferase [Planctomycetota bacterium]
MLFGNARTCFGIGWNLRRNTVALIDDIHSNAKKLQKAIILPESLEERNLKAAELIDKSGFGPLMLIGDQDETNAKAKSFGVNLGDAVLIDPATDENYDLYVHKLVELRGKKGVTEDKAKELLKDPLYYAAMMVKLEKADGYVSGAIHATGDVLRPALQIIKTAPGVKTVSSFFIMILPESSPYHATREVLFFADCAVVPQPNSDQLSDIAVSTAKSFKALMPAQEPKVAMLSFSTMGSAKHEDPDKVIEAVKLVKEKAPGLMVDGEMQADAALMASVAGKKCPDSKVGGQANILVFPDLEAGNIGYKLVERLAGAAAIGPVVQGLSRPVNDLSRGCSVQDIVDTVAVTACQAAD